MEAGERYWSILEPFWDSIDIDSAESFDRTFKSVPRSVGLLYAAHFCQSEVCNGGFTQFFWNSTGVLAPEAVEGFAVIGQRDVSGVVRRAMSLLGWQYERDRAARWVALRRVDTRKDEQTAPAEPGGYQRVKLFEPLEQEFYSLLRSEAGGFEIAADEYAERIPKNDNLSVSDIQHPFQGLLRKLRSENNAQAVRGQLANLKADIAKIRRKMSESEDDKLT